MLIRDWQETQKNDKAIREIVKLVENRRLGKRKIQRVTLVKLNN